MDKNKDLLLLNSLSRLRAVSRRRAPATDGAEHEKRNRTKPGRGFGHILDLLKENEGISSRRLVSALGLRAQSVSEAVSVLQERGFVERHTSEEDKRVSLIYITPRGIAHRKRRAEEREKRAAVLFSPLSEDEKDTLLSLLDKVSFACLEKEGK